MTSATTAGRDAIPGPMNGGPAPCSIDGRLPNSLIRGAARGQDCFDFAGTSHIGSTHPSAATLSWRSSPAWRFFRTNYFDLKKSRRVDS